MEDVLLAVNSGQEVASLQQTPMTVTVKYPIDGQTGSPEAEREMRP